MNNNMYFRDSVKGLLVGRFKSGKTFTACSAFNATGELDGQRYSILTPTLYVDVEGGAMSMGPLRGQPESVVKYVGVKTLDDFHMAMDLAETGAYRLAIFDGWSHLYIRFAQQARAEGRGSQYKNMGWNNAAADDVMMALERWYNLAVLPQTRGMVLLSTAALTDNGTGGPENRHVDGEKIKVSARVEDRLVGGHNFVWHSTRLDPSPIMTPEGGLDIAATNAAIRDKKIGPRFITYTYPFAGMPYVKAQEGFGANLDAIIERVDLGAVFTAHHAECGIKTLTPAVAA